jgi:hypothetical protein
MTTALVRAGLAGLVLASLVGAHATLRALGPQPPVNTRPLVDAQEEYARRYRYPPGIAGPPCVPPFFTPVAQRADAGEQYQASLVSPISARVGLGGQGPTIEIVIERWSSQETREHLIAVLATSSQNAFLDALMNAATVGYVRMTDASGYDLHYSHQRIDDDGMRRIVVATNRRIGTWEPRDSMAVDYPFSFIELTLNGDGDGQGRLAIAGRVSINRAAQRMDIQDANSESLLLQNVRRRIQDRR